MEKSKDGCLIELEGLTDQQTIQFQGLGTICASMHKGGELYICTAGR